MAEASKLSYEIELLLEQARRETAIDPDQSKTRLRTIIAEHSLGIATDRRFLEGVVFTGFRIGDLAAVETAALLCYPTLRRITLSVSNESPGAQVPVWGIEGRSGHSYRFSPSLFELPDGDLYTISTRWLACLTIAAAYDGELRGAGRVELDVGDWSSGVGLCFCDSRPDALLIPDSSFLASDGYRLARLRGREGEVPWASRQSVAIWRGSSTGISTGGLLTIPRVQLCRLSQSAEAAGRLDAGITAVVQATNPSDAAGLVASGLCKDEVSMPDHVHYKFQIDIDGNTNSWPGLFQKLLTGSPVLKVLSPYRQWYYHRLRPWINYVPVSSDLSDLLDLINFLSSNDDLARSIGRAGRELAEDMTLSAEIERSLLIVEAAINRARYCSERGR